MSKEFPPLVCDCGQTYEVAHAPTFCDCGGLYHLTESGGYQPKTESSMWGYNLPASSIRLDLGQGQGPLEYLRENCLVTRDDHNPTGSFKDRGAAILISLAAHLGKTHVCVDSSGNAGPAIAAFAKKAGMKATVVLPESTDPAKIANAEKYGARIIRVPGDRTASMKAVRQVAGEGAFYASHIYHPYFYEGVKTYVFDVYNAGHRPDNFIVPVGNGTLVLGCYRALIDLRNAGMIATFPRIIAVQAENCSPLVGGPVTSTIANGIAIPLPPRKDDILHAVDDTHGEIVTVGEDEIIAAQRDLAERGIWVEPTTATVWAAYRANTFTGLTHLHFGGADKAVAKATVELRQ